MARRLMCILPAIVLVMASVFPAWGYVAWDSRVRFMEDLTKDFIRLIPRSMGKYIYENRYDFFRGMTFMDRDVMANPRKIRDMEEIRREAYARLMRDIPYCVQAFKGGAIKLDTHANNVSGRLGMIAYSIFLQKIPEFPDLIYLERFTRTMEELISESTIDVWVFYDGYGDYCSLGELMETLNVGDMPTFKYIRDRDYNAKMKEDMFSIFRAPDQFTPHIVLTNRHVNNIYSNMINGIADAFTYIWKASGMDLAHPSYAAPPGTIINRPGRRAILSGGSVQKPGRKEAIWNRLVEEGQEALEESLDQAQERRSEAATADDVVD
ncbi:MAG: hypothetical protein RDU20_17785 [Desulfomonilaceae bacterium]|nr:hypothetical protein [Desulfomonilaceae bacterium]